MYRDNLNTRGKRPVTIKQYNNDDDDDDDDDDKGTCMIIEFQFQETEMW